MTLPTDVVQIISILEAAGHEAFVVGGCVRDTIRGVIPKDWDIATSATPVQAKALFKRVIDTGIKHGTITVVLNHRPYEVTTYRIDGEYLDNRRPETVKFTSNIEDDLSRRDFTINAIAYNPQKGFIDPFGGHTDIHAKIIRCVGDPMHRFGEDALRMLRAIRFAGVTGFSVCDKLLNATIKLRHNLADVSPERIRDELGKLIISPHPWAVELLHSTGLLPYVLQQTSTKSISGAAGWLMSCPPNEAMRMALFLQCCEIDLAQYETVLRKMRFENKIIKEISLYLHLLHTPNPQNRYEIKKALRHVPQDLFENLLTLKTIVDPSQGQIIQVICQESADIIKKGECFTLRDLAINGGDLAKLGVTPGEQMGDILENMLDAVMHNPSFNTREKLLSSVPIS